MTREIKGVDAVTRQIEALTEIGRQIRECGDIREVNKHRNVMEQLRLLAKRLGAGIDVQNAAWKETMQSRRAVGRMLIEMRENRQRTMGGRPKKNESSDGISFSTLEDLGLTNNESSRSQALFYIPEQTLANAIEAVEKNGGELVTRHFVEIGHWYKQREVEAQEPEDEEEDEEEDQEQPEDEEQGEQQEEDEEQPEQEQQEEEVAASSDDQPPDDAIRRGQEAWDSILQGYFRVVNSIREMGGADVLVKGWSPDAVREFAATFDLVIGKLGEIRDQLGRIADARD